MPFDENAFLDDFAAAYHAPPARPDPRMRALRAMLYESDAALAGADGPDFEEALLGELARGTARAAVADRAERPRLALQFVMQREMEDRRRRAQREDFDREQTALREEETREFGRQKETLEMQDRIRRGQNGGEEDVVRTVQRAAREEAARAGRLADAGVPAERAGQPDLQSLAVKLQRENFRKKADEYLRRAELAVAGLPAGADMLRFSHELSRLKDAAAAEFPALGDDVRRLHELMTERTLAALEQRRAAGWTPRTDQRRLYHYDPRVQRWAEGRLGEKESPNYAGYGGGVNPPDAPDPQEDPQNWAWLTPAEVEKRNARLRRPVAERRG